MAELETVKIAIVTGSNRGIGFSIVKKLAKEFKGKVYLTCRNAEKGQEAVKELEKQGFKVYYHQLDIEDKESIDKLADYLKNTYGGLDILINNAAVATVNRDDSIEKQAHDCQRINLVGTLNLCKALFPLLRDNARVVNISSRLGMLSQVKSKDLRAKLSTNNKDLKIDDILQVMDDFVEASKTNKYKEMHSSPYGISKACLTALTRLQQQAFDAEKSESRKIIVSAVCPGFCKTDMTHGQGFLTADQGADTPVYLALLPCDFNGPRGEFWAEREVVNWENGSMAIEFIKKTPFLIKSLFNR